MQNIPEPNFLVDFSVKYHEDGDFMPVLRRTQYTGTELLGLLRFNNIANGSHMNDGVCGFYSSERELPLARVLVLEAFGATNAPEMLRELLASAGMNVTIPDRQANVLPEPEPENDDTYADDQKIA